MLDERRLEPRLFCADTVDVQWKDQTGRMRRDVANLDDISRLGARLQLDRPIPLEAPLRIAYPNGDLTGKVRYCVLREVGYIIGVEFDPGCRWSPRSYKPRHLLNPGDIKRHERK